MPCVCECNDSGCSDSDCGWLGPSGPAAASDPSPESTEDWDDDARTIGGFVVVLSEPPESEGSKPKQASAKAKGRSRAPEGLKSSVFPLKNVDEVPPSVWVTVKNRPDGTQFYTCAEIGAEGTKAAATFKVMLDGGSGVNSSLKNLK